MQEKQPSEEEIIAGQLKGLQSLPEKEIQERLTESLSQFFFIYNEVVSVDNKSRIDSVLIHKSDTRAQYPMGLEIKTTQSMKGVKIADWLLQAHRYSKTEFKEFGRLIPFVFPQISGMYLSEGVLVSEHSLSDAQNNVSTFLSRFKVGELKLYRYQHWPSRMYSTFMRLAYKGQRVWDQNNDRFFKDKLSDLSKAA